MNYSEHNMPNTLPQFSELTTRNNVTTINYESNDQLQNIIYTAAADSINGKQSINFPNKYSNTISNLPESNIVMQLCDKQTFQAINIPAYNHNNASLNVQSQNLPMRIIQNPHTPQTDESIDKQILSQIIKLENEDINFSTMNLQNFQSMAVVECLQKLSPATVFPMLMKIQEQSKKDKDYEQRNDQILNIPNVPITYKTSHMQSESQYMNNDHSMLLNDTRIHPSDVNVHMEESPENHNNTQGLIQPPKMEQTRQAETTKPEKKMKFRAKTGEIKITIALDGSTLYCCPECNIGFSEKAEVDQHIQNHVQERKYSCKECGAMLKRKEHLDQHMRGHSDERPFKCRTCNKAFKRNEHLTRHQVIHSGDKHFTCTICQKAFSRKDHLNKHTQTHLAIKKVKPKKEIVEVPNNESTTASMLLKYPNDFNSLLKEKNPSQLLEHIQNLQKDPNFLQNFSTLQHVLKDNSMLQQQAVNMNEILPQNTRYVMP